MIVSKVERLAGVVGTLALLFAGLTGCGGTSSTAASGPSFANPVYRSDFPDPYVLKDGKAFFAYATNGNSENIQELKSSDLVHWADNGDAMPILPLWIDKDIWAPTVLRRKDGKYVLYYSAHSKSMGMQCLGRAISSSAAGRFQDSSTKPFFCQTGQGGTIDPDVFRDDNGKIYLYYKNDGNCCGKFTYLWSQQLSPDGLTLVGKSTRLVYNDQSWEGDVIEAPSMVKHDGKYYLFFSGAHWDSSSYSVGYATCTGPIGPCKDAPENPIVQYHFGGCNSEGPGGQTITTDAQNQTWILYHGWLGDAIGYDPIGGKRVLWMERLDWKNGKPVIKGPTCKAQPGPVLTK
ncbi:MAG: hypothetical protein NVSMB52_03190 [Chloroflexota bacterium]